MKERVTDVDEHFEQIDRFQMWFTFSGHLNKLQQITPCFKSCDEMVGEAFGVVAKEDRKVVGVLRCIKSSHVVDFSNEPLSCLEFGIFFQKMILFYKQYFDSHLATPYRKLIQSDFLLQPSTSCIVHT